MRTKTNPLGLQKVDLKKPRICNNFGNNLSVAKFPRSVTEVKLLIDSLKPACAKLTLVSTTISFWALPIPLIVFMSKSMLLLKVRYERKNLDKCSHG